MPKPEDDKDILVVNETVEQGPYVVGKTTLLDILADTIQSFVTVCGQHGVTISRAEIIGALFYNITAVLGTCAEGDVQPIIDTMIAKMPAAAKTAREAALASKPAAGRA